MPRGRSFGYPRLRAPLRFKTPQPAGAVVEAAASVVGVAAISAAGNRVFADGVATVGVAAITAAGGRRIGAGSAVAGVAVVTGAGNRQFAGAVPVVGVALTTGTASRRTAAAGALVGVAVVTGTPEGAVVSLPAGGGGSVGRRGKLIWGPISQPLRRRKVEAEGHVVVGVDVRGSAKVLRASGGTARGRGTGTGTAGVRTGPASFLRLGCRSSGDAGRVAGTAVYIRGSSAGHGAPGAIRDGVGPVVCRWAIAGFPRSRVSAGGGTGAGIRARGQQGAVRGSGGATEATIRAWSRPALRHAARGRLDVRDPLIRQRTEEDELLLLLV